MQSARLKRRCVGGSGESGISAECDLVCIYGVSSRYSHCASQQCCTVTARLPGPNPIPHFLQGGKRSIDAIHAVQAHTHSFKLRLLAADIYIVSRMGGGSDLQTAGKYNRYRVIFLPGRILFLLVVASRAR